VSTQENKALVRRFVDEVQSRGNIDALDEICSPEFVNHSAPPGVPSNCEGVKQLTAMFRQAFPDSYFTVEDMRAEGDKVATRKTFHGIHQDEFMGIPRPVAGCSRLTCISCVSGMARPSSTGG
jgi:predicted ester cyclase